MANSAMDKLIDIYGGGLNSTYSASSSEKSSTSGTTKSSDGFVYVAPRTREEDHKKLTSHSSVPATTSSSSSKSKSSASANTTKAGKTTFVNIKALGAGGNSAVSAGKVGQYDNTPKKKTPTPAEAAASQAEYDRLMSIDLQRH